MEKVQTVMEQEMRDRMGEINRVRGNVGVRGGKVPR